MSRRLMLARSAPLGPLQPPPVGAVSGTVSNEVGADGALTEGSVAPDGSEGADGSDPPPDPLFDPLPDPPPDPLFDPDPELPSDPPPEPLAACAALSVVKAGPQ